MKKIMNMMKKVLLALAFMFLLYPAMTASAEETKDFFCRLQDGQEFIVFVEWDHTQPVIKFKSPSGKIYNMFEESEDTALAAGKDSAFYTIYNAEAGEWDIIYDKLDNEELSVELQGTTKPIKVKDVSINRVTDSYIDLSFQVEDTAEEERYLEYYIYISANTNSKGMVVSSGYCQANETVELSLDISEVSSFSRYRFYVYAICTENGVDISDGVYSEPFSYVNPNQQAMESPAWIEVNPGELNARINWESNGNTYLVSIFEDGSEEPTIYEEVTDRSVNYYDFTYSENAKSIELRIAEKSYYGYSATKNFVCDLTKLPSVEFDAAEATNDKYAVFSYKNFPVDHKVEVEVNGETREISLNAKDSGKIGVEIGEDWNKIALKYYQSDDVIIVFSKKIYFNNEPPRIYMLKDYTDTLSTTELYEITGIVTGATGVNVGGNPVEIDMEGSFQAQVTLVEGENVIPIEAYDSIGNSSVYVAKITYIPQGVALVQDEDGNTVTTKTNGVMAWLPGIISSVLGLILIIFVAVRPKKTTKRGFFGNAKRVLMYLIGTIAAFEIFSLVQWFIVNRKTKSLDFINIAQDSMADAVKLLISEERWRVVIYYCSLAAGGAAVLLAIIMLIEKGVNSIKNKKNNAPAQKPAEPAKKEKKKEKKAEKPVEEQPKTEAKVTKTNPVEEKAPQAEVKANQTEVKADQTKAADDKVEASNDKKED